MAILMEEVAALRAMLRYLSHGERSRNGIHQGGPGFQYTFPMGLPFNQMRDQDHPLPSVGNAGVALALAVEVVKLNDPYFAKALKGARTTSEVSERRWLSHHQIHRIPLAALFTNKQIP